MILQVFKKTLKYLFVLFIGATGGMLWQTVFLPYLSERPGFQEVWFIKDFKERKVILYTTEQKIIEENKALVEAMEKVEASVVGIQTTTTKEAQLEGAGLVITADGLVVTLADLVPRGSTSSFLVNGKRAKFEVLERNLEKNLALVRFREQGLPTCGFADWGKVTKGQRVFLIGVLFSEKGPHKAVNEGIIEYLDSEFIRTNIVEDEKMKGSILFDIQGNVLGINTIGLDGEVLSIPISKIKDFAFQ